MYDFYVSTVLMHPLFVASSRATVWSSIRNDPALAPYKYGRFLVATANHGMFTYRRYGILGLFAGVEAIVVHRFMTSQVSDRLLGGMKFGRKRSACRLVVDALFYPLLVIGSRLATYAGPLGGAKSWGWGLCIRETLFYDGVVGFWKGLAPFVLATCVCESIDAVTRKFQNSRSDLDEVDSGIISATSFGAKSIMTGPLLTMSLVARCQSEIPLLPPPQTTLELLGSVNWRSFALETFLIASVAGLAYLNIVERHKYLESQKGRGKRESVLFDRLNDVRPLNG